MGYLPLTTENRKFQLENQMVLAIPFWKIQKVAAAIYGNAIFLHLEVCSADLDILCSAFYSHKKCLVKKIMFIHKISSRVVNGKHPWILKKKTNKKCVVIQKKMW